MSITKDEFLLMDKDDFLPLGSHLLAQEYQDFLATWNKIFQAATSGWTLDHKIAFKLYFPRMWAIYRSDHNILRKRYDAQVKLVIEYQKEHKNVE
jgi:hypothetical protein